MGEIRHSGEFPNEPSIMNYDAAKAREEKAEKRNFLKQELEDSHAKEDEALRIESDLTEDQNKREKLTRSLVEERQMNRQAKHAKRKSH